MQVVDGGGGGVRGTGRLDDAGRRAAEEAAKRAAAEAARRAAEAAARAAAEAAKRAAEAAAKSASKQNTGRLSEAKHADFGHMPWEAAAGAVAAVTGSAAYTTLKNSLSVQKKVQDIQKTVKEVGTAVNQARESGESVMGKLKNGVATAGSAPKPPSKAFEALGKLNSAVRVTGAINSAFNLKKDFKNLTDGDITVKDVTSTIANSTNVLRGIDEGAKLVGGKALLGKMAPGIGIVASTADAVKRVDNLRHWGEMSNKDRVANVAYLVGDAADLVGNFFPPAKAVGAGLALVGMAAENWDSVKAGAKAVAGAVSNAAQAVDHAVDNAVGAVANKAKEVSSKITSGIKSVFGGL